MIGFFLFPIINMKTNSLKQQLYDFCAEYVDQRIASYKKAMHDAQEAANSEGKSSAGDKYETGRAMMQIERDKNAKQLEEALKLDKTLKSFSPLKENSLIDLGSLIHTDKGIFYISISAGKIEIEKKHYFAIAPTAPLALLFINKKKGDTVSFNNTTYVIEKVI